MQTEAGPTQTWSMHSQPASEQEPQSRVRPQPSPMVPQYWPPLFAQATDVQPGRAQIPELVHCQPPGQAPHSRVPQQPSPIRPQYWVSCFAHVPQMPIASEAASTVPLVASGTIAPSGPLSGGRITSLRSGIPVASPTTPGPASSPPSDRPRKGEWQAAQLAATTATAAHGLHTALLEFVLVCMAVRPS